LRPLPWVIRLDLPSRTKTPRAATHASYELPEPINHHRRDIFVYRLFDGLNLEVKFVIGIPAALTAIEPLAFGRTMSCGFRHILLSFPSPFVTS